MIGIVFIILANVKHIHPPISDSEFKEEAEGGLDDAACSMSSLWGWVRNAWVNGNRPVDKVLKIAILVWLVNLAVHFLILCKVLINLL